MTCNQLVKDAPNDMLTTALINREWYNALPLRNWPQRKSIIVNTLRTVSTKSPSASCMAQMCNTVKLMVMLPSSSAIVPQMKIAGTGLTRKAAARAFAREYGLWLYAGSYM